MKRPPNDAPTWRWKLYNNANGYSRPGKIVRGMIFDVGLGLLESWRLLWRWSLPIAFALLMERLV